MPSQVIGEWTDKHQKAVEAWCGRVLERKLREMEEVERAGERDGSNADHNKRPDQRIIDQAWH